MAVDTGAVLLLKSWIFNLSWIFSLSGLYLNRANLNLIKNRIRQNFKFVADCKFAGLCQICKDPDHKSFSCLCNWNSRISEGKVFKTCEEQRTSQQNISNSQKCHFLEGKDHFCGQPCFQLKCLTPVLCIALHCVKPHSSIFTWCHPHSSIFLHFHPHSSTVINFPCPPCLRFSSEPASFKK